MLLARAGVPLNFEKPTSRCMSSPTVIRPPNGATPVPRSLLKYFYTTTRDLTVLEQLLVQSNP